MPDMTVVLNEVSVDALLLDLRQQPDGGADRALGGHERFSYIRRRLVRRIGDEQPHLVGRRGHGEGFLERNHGETRLA